MRVEVPSRTKRGEEEEEGDSACGLIESEESMRREDPEKEKREKEREEGRRKETEERVRDGEEEEKRLSSWLFVSSFGREKKRKEKRADAAREYVAVVGTERRGGDLEKENKRERECFHDSITDITFQSNRRSDRYSQIKTNPHEKDKKKGENTKMKTKAERQ